jgi:hypothetical protein
MTLSQSLFGAKKITLSTTTVQPDDGREEYCYSKVSFKDGDDRELMEASAFYCNGITIENADRFDISKVTSADGNVRLEITLPMPKDTTNETVEKVKLKLVTESV